MLFYFNIQPFLLSILLLSTTQVLAQVSAPTLSAGLSAVTASKGNIDVELLAEIISQKQDELKREFLQRQVLQRMNGKSFAMKNFAYSSFAALLTFKDQKAIERELLKQVSILSLHVGIAETMLQLSFRADHPQARPSAEITNALKKYIASQYKVSESEANRIYSEFEEVAKSHHFMLLFSIDNILDNLVYGSGQSVKNRNGNFSSILVDCVFEICRRKTALQELGFIQINPNLRANYGDQNLYIAHAKSVPDLEVLVSQSVDVLVDYHPLFHDFIHEPGMTINDIHDITSQSITMSTSLKGDIQLAKSYVSELSDGMNELLKQSSIESKEVEILMEELNDIQHGLSEFEIRKTDAEGRTIVTMSDYLFMKQYVDPLSNKMVALGILKEEHIEQIARIKASIYGSLVEQVKRDIDSKSAINNIDEIEIADYSHLLQLITSLSELDDVRSYEHIFNMLVQLGLNQTQHAEIKFVRELTYYIDAYTDINLRDDLIHVAVEPLLLKLLSTYENRVSKNIQPYFGIGLNQTTDIDYHGVQNQLTNSKGEVIRDLGFASEKVGLKVKLLNNKRLQSLDVDEVHGPVRKLFRGKSDHVNANPLVSDVYLFSFGSGLLYNVANLTTQGDDFNAVLVGAGIGIAFFNALDISFWRSSPMVGGGSLGNKIEDRAFYGLSFDIKLTEYLSELSKKRRAGRLVSQATDNSGN